jgi:enoyl-CoA hydratase
MADELILVEVADRIGTVTLNRPAARNALSAAMRADLVRAVEDLDAAPDVDAIVLTGADPAFCAGLDLKELGSGEHGIEEVIGDEDTPFRPIPRSTTPIVGAVNGVAVTGGFELALNCDFLVASERARFADTHARVGVQPSWGLTVLLTQAIGVRRAREMSATGNFVDAETALTWGLVNHVVAHDELLPFARSLASDIVSSDATGVQAILGTYREIVDLTEAEGRSIETRNATAWVGSGKGGAEEVERRRAAVLDRGRGQAEQGGSS